MLAVTWFGCEPPPSTDVGATEVALAVPSGSSIVEIAWVVESSTGSVVASGSEDLTLSQTTLSLNLVLPVGRGDLLELSALTGDGVLCGGISPPFDVSAGDWASVFVPLTCETTVYSPSSCPAVLVQGPTPPVATAPAGTISVAASASEPDGMGVPSFAWSATAGTFADPAAASTLYTCSVAGTQTIVLAVTGGQPPTSCTTTFLLPVTCLAPSAAP